MERPRTDSPISRRIVMAFLDFLKTVEPAPNVDIEGLDIVQECLEEVFKIDQSSGVDLTQPGLLVDLFSSLEANKRSINLTSTSLDGSSTTSAQDTVEPSKSSKSLMDDLCGNSHVSEASKDILFVQFFAGLDKLNFWMTTPNGDDDQVQLAKATSVFDDAFMEMEKSRCPVNQHNLADAFKLRGNQAMQSKSYSDAIELYTFAIALCGKNAIYYCNRAAAFTQIHKYNEAIEDCRISIEIDPNYSKAYSRLGLAYFAQGNYNDAINKGFLKALQLDPNNTSVRENIQVAAQKLHEAHQRTTQEANAGSTSSQTSNSQSTGQRNQSCPFSSFSFGGPAVPEISNIFMNMASSVHQGQQPRNMPLNGNASAPVEPETGIDGNINLNFGDITQDISGALRSVMGRMFPPPNDPQDDAPRDSGSG